MPRNNEADRRRQRRWGWLALLLLWPPVTVSAEEAAPIKVLFIGNSYIQFNGLPSMIAALAKAAGKRPLEFDKEWPGGFALKKHWDAGRAVKKIRARKWDFVVLQEHSQGPIRARKAMHQYARKLDAEIKQQGAKTLFFLTWAREHLPEMQQGLNDAYFDIAKKLDADVAPVGIAWKAARAADPKLKLYEPDKSHPRSAGTYLSACVFYSVIYGKSAEGLPGKIGGLTDEQAQRLQAIAWKTVGQVKQLRQE
jgi:hypothetical protein